MKNRTAKLAKYTYILNTRTFPTFKKGQGAAGKKGLFFYSKGYVLDA